MLQFDLFVTVFYAAVRSASNSIRFCKKQLLSCLLAIYIGRGLEYFRGNFKFFSNLFFDLIFAIALLSQHSLFLHSYNLYTPLDIFAFYSNYYILTNLHLMFQL